jgi:hypothetical protein
MDKRWKLIGSFPATCYNSCFSFTESQAVDGNLIVTDYSRCRHTGGCSGTTESIEIFSAENMKDGVDSVPAERGMAVIYGFARVIGGQVVEVWTEVE